MKHKKVEVSSAELIVGESVSMLVIRHLLEGKLEVRVTVEGKNYTGYVHKLDFSKGGGFVVASVHVPDLDWEEEWMGHGEPARTISHPVYVTVGIRPDGSVTVASVNDE